MREHVIMILLDHYGPLTGLELVRLSSGHLTRGTVYVALSTMQDDGLVFSDVIHEGGAPARHVYRISEWGLRKLRYHQPMKASIFNPIGWLVAMLVGIAFVIADAVLNPTADTGPLAWAGFAIVAVALAVAVIGKIKQYRG